MKSFIWFIFLMKISFSFSFSCTFEKFSKNYLPIFTYTDNRRTLLYPIDNHSVKIPEGRSYEIHCPNGFREIEEVKERNREGYSDLDETKSNINLDTLRKLKLSCNHGKIEIYAKENRILTDSILSCKQPSVNFYEPKEPYYVYDCGKPLKAALFLGVQLELSGKPVIFAKACYNIKEMKLEYVHYVEATRSYDINEEYTYFPYMYNNRQLEFTTMESFNFQKRIEIINNEIKSIIGDTSEVAEYIYDTLWPTNAFVPFVNESVEFGNSITNILWWKPLRYGNWKLFENALRELSKKHTFSVVMGTSGVVYGRVPSCRDKKELSFTFNGKHGAQVVPMFIWAQFLDDFDKEYVAIGINSPYADSDKIENAQNCENDCENLKWLGPLLDLKHNSALGYMLCCKRENADLIIKNLPHYGNSIYNLYEKYRPKLPTDYSPSYYDQNNTVKKNDEENNEVNENDENEDNKNDGYTDYGMDPMLMSTTTTTEKSWASMNYFYSNRRKRLLNSGMNEESHPEEDHSNGSNLTVAYDEVLT